MKLCYILPKYDAHSEEHFSHTVRTLEALAQHVDLTVVVKRAVGNVAIAGAERIMVQRGRGLLRLVELTQMLIAARRAGCRTFFTHYSYSGCVISALVARLTGARACYWHCGQPKQYYPDRWSLRWDVLAKKLGDELPFRLCLRLCHRLVTGTRRMADYYVREFGIECGKIIVVPNDIDLTHFRPRDPDLREAKIGLGLPPETPVVLFVHRLSPRKGAQYLADIVARVREAVPGVTFLVAGGGPYETLVRRQVAERGVGDAVKLVGWVPNREAPRYYAAADVFIMPSDEEGFPRVLLEAQAVGVPFVATDVGGVLDIVTPIQTKYVVPKGDVAAFVECIVALLRAPELWQQLTVEGLRNVQQYDVERVAPFFVEKVVI